MTTLLRNFFPLLLAGSVLSGSVTFAQSLPLPSHIVVLIEENYAYTEIIGSSASAYAPNLNALAGNPNSAVFSQSFAIEHPSEPNYLDFYSGNNQGMAGSDGVPPAHFTTPNLGAELLAAGKTFLTYSEDLPSPGYDGATYTSGGANYARKHNPCANWMGTGSNQYSGTLINLPLVEYFPDSANYSSLPTVSYLVPNMTNDMHDGTYPSNIVIGDTWFKTHLDSFLNWALANNTLLIVTFDEDDDLHNNNIPTIFYGPMVKGGMYNQQITHFSVLRTIEQMYGLPYAGEAADSGAITFCWKELAVKNVINNNFSFNVTPNPGSDFVVFNCNNPMKNELTISVTDAFGRIAGTYNMNGNQMRINTSSFAPGVYFYKALSEGNYLAGEGRLVITHN
jgi:acid phosphatase